MERKNITFGELLQRYAAGERDFRKIHLVFDEYERDKWGEARFDESGDVIMRPGIKEGCLRGTNLSGTDFRGSNLRAIRMYSQGLILCHANLSKLDLNYLLFMGSNLSGANIFHADFLRANLSGAKLDRVIASDASFTSVNLTSASFIQATLTNTHFGGVDLTTVNFRNARNAYFPEATLKDTIMPDGSLRSS